MAIAIIIFGALAVGHFVYESIVAPGARVTHRYRIFKLRDDLRTLFYDFQHQIPEATFEAMDRSLSRQIECASSYTFVSFIKANLKYRKDEAFKKRVDDEVLLLSGAELPAYRTIRQEANKAFMQISAVNSGMFLLFYGLPIYAVVAPFENFKKHLKAASVRMEAVGTRDLQRIAAC